MTKCAITAPSWGGPYVFPHIYQLGVEFVKNFFNFEVYELDSVNKSPEFLRDHPDFRAKELEKALLSEEFDYIFSAIGGEESIRILKYLHPDKLKTIRKKAIFVGFSDVTTIHFFLNKLGYLTYYGPSIMAGFAQAPNLGDHFLKHLEEVFLEPNKKIIYYKPYSFYVEGYPDWSRKELAGRTNKKLPNKTKWVFINTKNTSKIEGKVIGGSWEIMDQLRGTKYFNEETFDNKILLLELSEGVFSETWIRNSLVALGEIGVWSRIKALIIGRSRGDTLKPIQTAVEDIVLNDYKAQIPIILNFDIGHTDPQLIMPLGGDTIVIETGNIYWVRK